MGWFNQFFFQNLWVHAVDVDLGGYIPSNIWQWGLPSGIPSSVHTMKNTALMELSHWWTGCSLLSVEVANLTKSALFCISPFNFS